MHLSVGFLGNKRDTLLYVLLEVAEAGRNELLLSGIDLADWQDLLNSVGTELDSAAEELDTLVFVEGRFDKAGLNDALLATSGAEDGIGHAGAGHGHGEGGRASTVLGLNDLVTAKLNALDELLVGA